MQLVASAVSWGASAALLPGTISVWNGTPPALLATNTTYALWKHLENRLGRRYACTKHVLKHFLMAVKKLNTVSAAFHMSTITIGLRGHECCAFLCILKVLYFQYAIILSESIFRSRFCCYKS